MSTMARYGSISEVPGVVAVHGGLPYVVYCSAAMATEPILP